MEIKICSKLEAPNKLSIGNHEQLIPACSEFIIEVRYWAEIKRSKRKWIEGQHIFAASEAEELELLNEYEDSFRNELSKKGNERVKQILTTKNKFTGFEVQIAEEWLADEKHYSIVRAENRESESLEISKRSELHAKRSNKIAILAFVVSVIALSWAMYSSSVAP